METLIVSKTRTNNGRSRCVGGIVLENHRSVRLVQANGNYWPEDCDINIGEIWDVQFHNRPGLIPPFVEDVLVLNRVYQHNVDSVCQYLRTIENQIANIFWRGSINTIYEGRIAFQVSNGRAYIEVGNEPAMSTGFWVPSSDLVLQQDNRHYSCGWQVIVYVGENQPPLPIIPAGTLCRVSLARPFQPHPDVSSRYYVQLSGWYL